MLLDNDLDIRKNVQNYAESMKKLRRDIKQYVAWVRQNQQNGTRGFTLKLIEIQFETKTGKSDYFVVKLTEDQHRIVESHFSYQMLTIGFIRANKNANNTYTDVIFNLVKDYVELHNIDISLYKIRYKSL